MPRTKRVPKPEPEPEPQPEPKPQVVPVPETKELMSESVNIEDDSTDEIPEPVPDVKPVVAEPIKAIVRFNDEALALIGQMIYSAAFMGAGLTLAGYTLGQMLVELIKNLLSNANQ